MNWWKWLGSIFLVGSIVVALVVLNAYQSLTKPLPLDNAQVFEVEQGDYLNRVVWRIQQQGWINNTFWARWYGRLAKLQDIRAGEFLIQPGMSLVDTLRLLNSNEVIQYQVTLVEGHTVRQFLETLASQEKLIKVDPVLSFDNLMERLGQPETHPEGQLAPETYRYVRGMSDLDVVRQAYQRQQELLTKLWPQRQEGLPIKTPNEALILASIVEKETGVASERQQIAGVFIRRLQKNMRLQTDPTVIYGMGDSYTGNITRQDLRTYTPYNTYRINGLPPTPIANPGEDAIYAALHPAEGKELYFVAKGDGSHHFSATLKEHNEAVRQFQKYGRRREGYQSAPDTE